MKKLYIFEFLLLVLMINYSQCVMTVEQAGLFISQQVLVTDISHEILVNKVAKFLNVSYLSEIKLDENLIQTNNKYFGKVWGTRARVFVNLPVRLSRQNCPKLINIIFLVNIGAPITTLTPEALETLFGNCPNAQGIFSDRYKVKIAGKEIQVSKSRDHYQTLNILGGDFLRYFNARVEVNYFDSDQNEETIIWKKKKNRPNRIKIANKNRFLNG